MREFGLVLAKTSVEMLVDLIKSKLIKKYFIECICYFYTTFVCLFFISKKADLIRDIKLDLKTKNKIKDALRKHLIAMHMPTTFYISIEHLM